MMIGLPFVIVQLIAAWFLLQKLFPSQVNFLILELDGQFQRSWQAIVVYITFFSTVLLWMTTQVHGMNTYVVAMVPLVIFTLTGIIGKTEPPTNKLGCTMVGGRRHRHRYGTR